DSTGTTTTRADRPTGCSHLAVARHRRLEVKRLLLLLLRAPVCSFVGGWPPSLLARPCCQVCTDEGGGRGIIMTDAEALNEPAHECSCRILGLLHVRGQYFHCTSARFPGKVLCFKHDSEVPADCTPTPAQAHIWKTRGHDAPKGATG